MKYITLFLFLFATHIVSGQRKITPTDSLEISGDIKNKYSVTISEIENLPGTSLSDLILTNQLGEIKDTIRQLKGVLLKPILEKAEFTVDKPKFYNEFYFTFIASDGYKAVFSWNEIFNTETGNSLYLITEMDGKKIKDMDERILVLSTKDFKTGRRHIRGLSKIIVSRAD